MPEGDTIHRIAASLGPRLTGKRLERVTTQGLVRNVAGATVTSVAAHGKHLVIELDSGAYLRAHLGMNGRFRAHGRAAGDALLARMSPGRVSLALVTDDAVYLWLGAPTIEISHRRKPLHGTAVAALGPDVLAPDFDSRAAAVRAAEHGDRMIAEVLLDQRVVAGIGNIWKSESLHAAGVDPFHRVAELDDATITNILTIARKQLRASANATSRVRHSVYGAKLCRKCGTRIEYRKQGEDVRGTYWCPKCQM